MDLLDQKSLSQCLEHGPDTFKHGLKAEAGRPGLVLICSSSCNATNLGISKEIAQAVTRKLCNLAISLEEVVAEATSPVHFP